MNNIENKLILITGGASGIGRIMAFEFARRGARAAVWDLNSAALKALEIEAAAAGHEFITAVCDVSDKKAVYRAAGELTAQYGPLDILINNAGVVYGKTLLEIQDEHIEKTFDVNVLSLFWTTKAFLPAMLERNRGHIVTIASAGGLIGVRGLADYCAGKFAAVGFDESLRMELGRLKSAVKTTIICPFFIDTGMFEGVKTRLPFLLPIMKSDRAARRIVAAILRNKKRFLMPRFVYSVLILRLFPPAIIDAVAGFFGINHAMDEFTGRRPGDTLKKTITCSLRKY
jgi:all-trans-retinol dehydrogenase (NAD+)